MTCVHKIRWTVRPPEDCRFRLSVSHYKDRIVAPDEYSGVTVVTPSDAEQVLATKDKLVRDDIKINPAPEPDLRSLAVSENGTYEPDDFDGYSDVTVDVLNVIENLLEVVSSVTPSEDTKSLEFPLTDIKTGMYIIVSDPPGTREFASQQTAAETLNMVEFDIRGVTGGSLQSQGYTICYRKTPTSAQETDWWTSKITLGENSIIVNPTQGRYSYLAGVTYYLLRVKGA